MSWHLIYNELKILVDPEYFADKSTIQEQVNFIDMLQDYLENTEPALCDVVFYYPKYIEEESNIRRVFNTFDTKIVFVEKPKTELNFFKEDFLVDPAIRARQNELLAVAAENKIPFVLSNLELPGREELDLMSAHNITFLKRPALQEKVKSFTQGFFNYYKFDLLYGIDSPDIAHAMSDPLHKRLYSFENEIKSTELSDTTKERVRSFVHNRYVDILVSTEKITFYKVQQQISDIEKGILDNKEPRFNGAIRYYLNYYLLLLWGYVDHMCLIINDVFEFGYNSERSKDRKKIGLRNCPEKQEYLEKIKEVDLDLYNFVVSIDFQEWLDVLGQLRHKNAHREMISPAPLVQPTPQSEISDEEIDAILYKEKPPIDEGVARIMPSLVETQKILDRHHYKISKMEKLFDHVAVVKGGFLDPVARIEIDMKNLKELTTLFLKAAAKTKILTKK